MRKFYFVLVGMVFACVGFVIIQTNISHSGILRVYAQEKKCFVRTNYQCDSEDPKENKISLAWDLDAGENGLCLVYVQYTVNGVNQLRNISDFCKGTKEFTDAESINSFGFGENDIYDFIIDNKSNCLNVDRVDVKKEIEVCKQNLTPVSKKDFRQRLIDEYNLELDGFEERYLQWAYEQLNSLQHTGLQQILKEGRRHKFSARAGGGGEVGVLFCDKTDIFSFGRIGKDVDETEFKHVILHELAHRIDSCYPLSRSLSHIHRKAFEEEGPVSYYANCGAIESGRSKGLRIAEDYAETIAYYLNPRFMSNSRLVTRNINIDESSCGSTIYEVRNNNYKVGNNLVYPTKFIKHFDFASKVLSKGQGW